jgi:adenylyltransferase/sulfurtransferase
MLFPPLVEPASRLGDAEARRSARQRRLPEIGEVGQRRLAAARVAVIGAGGIGSPVLLYLASAGVGTIGIVDDDVVDESNLQRQVLFGIGDVGRPKSEVAAERIRALAPDTEVRELRQWLTAENAVSLLDGYDLVIDGSDSFETRYSVADACDALGVPLVWGSVLQFDAQVSVFWSRPTAGQAIGLCDVFPEPPAAGTVPSCAEAGVVGSLCGQVGSLLVTEAVKLVCGIGEPLVGRMLVLDARTARTREVALAPAVDARLQYVLPGELASLRASREVALVDVRRPDEVAAGTIPGAAAVPLDTLLAHPDAVPEGETILLFCQLGPRSRAAGRALRAARPDARVLLLAGGYGAWAAQAGEDARQAASATEGPGATTEPGPTNDTGATSKPGPTSKPGAAKESA